MYIRFITYVESVFMIYFFILRWYRLTWYIHLLGNIHSIGPMLLQSRMELLKKHFVGKVNDVYWYAFRHSKVDVVFLVLLYLLLVTVLFCSINFLRTVFAFVLDLSTNYSAHFRRYMLPCSNHLPCCHRN